MFIVKKNCHDDICLQGYAGKFYEPIGNQWGASLIESTKMFSSEFHPQLSSTYRWGRKNGRKRARHCTFFRGRPTICALGTYWKRTAITETAPRLASSKKVEATCDPSPLGAPLVCTRCDLSAPRDSPFCWTGGRRPALRWKATPESAERPIGGRRRGTDINRRRQTWTDPSAGSSWCASPGSEGVIVKTEF